MTEFHRVSTVNSSSGDKNSVFPNLADTLMSNRIDGFIMQSNITNVNDHDKCHNLSQLKQINFEI